MRGERLAPRLWSNMRTSTDQQSIDIAVSNGNLRQLIAGNHEYLLGKFVGDANLSEEKLLDSLLATTTARVSQGKAAVESLEEGTTSRTIGIAVGELDSWD